MKLSPGGYGFPGVDLVPHIDLKAHPLGRYLWDKKRIQLSREELENRPSDDRRFALYHELGHWWHSQNIPELKDEEDQEEFATAFAFYFVSPEKLGHRAKVYFQNCLPNKSEISSFAKPVVERLDNELG